MATHARAEEEEGGDTTHTVQEAASLAPHHLLSVFPPQPLS